VSAATLRKTFRSLDLFPGGNTGKNPRREYAFLTTPMPPLNVYKLFTSGQEFFPAEAGLKRRARCV